MHMRRHTGERNYPCPVCAKAFARSDGLRKHLSCYHGGMKPFQCPVCQRSFKGHFLQHLRTHTDEKPFRCETCGHCFAQRSQLKVHMRTHTGERPYKCKICKQAFSHSTALKLHIRLHTGEKPFQCQLCPSSFLQLPHLKKHMRCIHKKDRPYVCLPCNVFFHTKNELTQHTAQHDPPAQDGGAKDAQQQQDRKHKSASAGSDSDSSAASTDSSNGAVVRPCVQLPDGTKIELVQNICNSANGGAAAMSLERMRMLLAILLKRISTAGRLRKLGYGQKLIDIVLAKSIESSGRCPVSAEDPTTDPKQLLKRNIEILLDWTIPKEYMDHFRNEKKTVEEILEELTS